MIRKGRKRLNIDIPDMVYDHIKAIVQKRNITLTKYVVRALVRYSLDEARYEIRKD